jgi:hypothetical protein
LETWNIFWIIFFFLSLIIFAAIAILVTIGGFADIRSLFKSIDEHHAEEKDASGE